jgi:c-di-GMP-specific phosphodiesterase
LPFSKIKLDRSLIADMDSGERVAMLVSTLVQWSRASDLEIVAEGVENAGLARRLIDAQCHYGQGFGYAPALPAQEAEVYLNESVADGAAPIKARSG